MQTVNIGKHLRPALAALVFATIAHAQTIAYLRDYGSDFYIDSVSNTTPVRVYPHQDWGVAPGDVVGIWNVILDTGSGCGSGGMLQGRFKVKTISPDHSFTITDMNGVDVPAQGTWCNGNTPGYNGGAQWGGKIVPYTLATGPKGMFDGWTGPFTRSLALGTHNGLVSLTASGNVCTATTNYTHDYQTGDQVGVWGSGNSALDAGHNPYTVTRDSDMQFHWTCNGVGNGTYTGAKMTCGLSGNADCLRLSRRAWTGNPWWTPVVTQAGFAANRAYYDCQSGGSDPLTCSHGAVTSAHGPPLAGWNLPDYLVSMAIKVLVDPTDSLAVGSLQYWLRNPERIAGVNWAANETANQAGIGNDIDFVTVAMRGLGAMYAVGRDYLTSGERVSFRNKMLNDIFDPGSCNKVTPQFKSGTTASYSGGILTGVGTLWMTDSNTGYRLSVGDAIMAGFPGTEYYITEVLSDTQARAISASPSGTPFSPFVIHKWTPGDCGLAWLQEHWVGGWVQPYFYGINGGSSTNSPFTNDPRPGRAGNNGYTAFSGYFSLMLNLADEDPRAVAYLEKAQSKWWNFDLPMSLHYRTGLEHTGSYYNWSRTIPHSTEAATWIQQSVSGFPDLDLGGNWISRVTMARIFGVWPQMYNGTRWYLRYGTENSPTDLAPVDKSEPTGNFVADFGLRWAPTSNESRYWRSWLTTQGWWGGSQVALQNAALAFLANGDPRVAPGLDYTTLPTQYLFRSTSQARCSPLGLVCPATIRGDGFISRTGWSSQSDTHVYFGARTFQADHDIPEPGTIRVYKTGHLLNRAGLAAAPHGGAANASTDSTWLDNMIEFNGAPSWRKDTNSPVAETTAVATIDRWAGTDPSGDSQSKYAYARADLSQAYTTPITRAFRHLAHFKKSGSEEILIEYTDVALPTPAQIRSQIHYPQNGEGVPVAQPTQPPEGQTTCPGAGGCNNLDNTRWIREEQSGAGIYTSALTTKILAPDSVQVRWDGDNYTGNVGRDYRVSICGGFCGANALFLEYMAVHKITTVGDQAITAELLNAEPGWTGAQTADKVALFSREGRERLVARTQTSHAGIAQYLVVGLEGGQTYRAYRHDDNSDIAIADVNAGDNTLYFEGPAGTYSIFPVGLSTLILRRAPPVRTRQPMQYDFKMAGDPHTYTWTVGSGTLPPGLQLGTDGILSGIPIQAGEYVVTIQAQENGSTAPPAEAALTFTVTAPPMTTTVTAAARHGAVVTYGHSGMDAQQHCAITVSTQPDFSSVLEATIDNGGASRRTAVLGESSPLQAATDYYVKAQCGTEEDAAQFRTAIAPPVPTMLAISTGPPARIAAARMSVRYGPTAQLGGEATQACGSRCEVSIPATSDEIVYIQRVFLDGADRIVAQSGVAPVVVPQPHN